MENANVSFRGNARFDRVRGKARVEVPRNDRIGLPIPEPPNTNRGVSRQKEGLTATIDWCQITIKQITLKAIVHDILKIPEDIMLTAIPEKGIAGHEIVAGFDNIKVLKPTGKKQYEGYQILMSGTGCRNYEVFLENNQETWIEFLKRVSQYQVNFPRIDLAIDDRRPYLDIEELIRQAEAGLVSSKVRSITIYRKSDLVEEGIIKGGNTLYLGSSSSEFRLVLYEKGYEQAEKHGIEADPNWNRYELRFKQQQAGKVVEELIQQKQVSEVALSILNEKVRFLQKPEKSKGVRKRLYPTYEPWAEFMKGVKKLKLVTNPQKKNLLSTWNWLDRSVAPSLKMFKELGEREKVDYIETLIQNGQMSMEQKRLLDEYLKFGNF